MVGTLIKTNFITNKVKITFFKTINQEKVLIGVTKQFVKKNICRLTHA